MTVQSSRAWLLACACAPSDIDDDVDDDKQRGAGVSCKMFSSMRHCCCCCYWSVRAITPAARPLQSLGVSTNAYHS
jgi:hypothetical protein